MDRSTAASTLPRTLSWLRLGLLLLIAWPCATPAVAAPARLPPSAVASTPVPALEVLDISERSREGRNAIAVTLSAALDPAQNHQPYLSVAGPGGTLVDGAWVLDERNKILWFPHTEPDRDYTVTLYQGLTAANRGQLAQTRVEKLHTRSLEATVSFATQGAFLTAGVGNGLPVATVNVAQVDIDLFRVKEERIADLLAEISDRSDFDWGLDDLARMGDLVHGGRYDLTPPRNTYTKRTLPVASLPALAQPGVYLAVMRPSGGYDMGRRVIWFAITDIGLHARLYDPIGSQRWDIHASSLRNGAPLPGVDVTLLGKEGKRLAQGRTSPAGVATLMKPSEEVRLILARQGSQLSLIEMAQPALDLTELDIGKRPQLPVEVFLYAPRDLYRPGETMEFGALVRDGDGRATQYPVFKARVLGPDGVQAGTLRLTPDESGFYRSAFDIPADARTGSWSLEIADVVKTPVRYKFHVEDFMPERMRLDLNPQGPQRAVAGAEETLSVAVAGAWLYGAPASGSRLQSRVQVSHWRSPVEVLPGFQFGDEEDKDPVQQFDLDEIKLDEAGLGQVEVESHWQSARSPLEVKLIASLLESGGRPVTRAYSSLVWPSPLMLGIKPSFGEANPPPNTEVAFELIKAGLDGKGVAAPGVQVTLIREDRNYFWVYSQSDGWHYEHTDKNYPEYATTVDLAADRPTPVKVPVQWGAYRLEVREPEGGLLSSLRFYAGEDWYERWERANSQEGTRPDKVTLALDKGAYKGGDVARVHIAPPEAGEALLMVEGSGPLWMKRMSIAAEGATVEIPIDPAWNEHNLYVTALVVRPAESPNATKPVVTPKRALGLVHLPLDREARRLQVLLDAPEKVRPDREQPVQVQVTRADGTPAAGARVTLAAVDVGVLAISKFRTPDPWEGFFGQRRYAPELRDLYAKVIEPDLSAQARMRFGGDLDLGKAGAMARAEVLILSLFQGPVTLDAEGRAEVPLRLPYFNGRARIMALAWSDDAYGSAERDMTIAAPVVTDISLPRFLAGGDRSQVVVDVANMSGASVTLNARMSAEGAARIEGETQALTLADGAKAVLQWPIIATAPAGQARIRLNVTGEGLEPVERTRRLNLRPAYPAVTLRHSRVLKQGESFQIGADDLAALVPETVRARLAVSDRADLNLAEHLDGLLAYPYGCLEQTSSRIYPLVHATPENQARFGIKPVAEGERLAMIQAGLGRIATMQLHNGGYGLWDNDSPEEHWLTAYVGESLVRLREQGVDVPEAMLSKTLARLKYYVENGGSLFEERWSDNADHYRFSYKAYAGYVLSLVNQAPLGALRTLYDNQSKQAAAGLPLIQLGIALIRQGDAQRGQEAVKRGLAVTGRTGYLGDYGSDIRDLALEIHLLITHGLDPAHALEMSFNLVERMKQRRWFSTQERNAMFLAGIALESGRMGQWRGELRQNGVLKTLEQTGAYRAIVDGETLGQGIEVVAESPQLLFVGFEINGYPVAPPAPSESGFSIQRQYFDMDGNPVTPESMKSGDMLIVQLSVAAKERTPDALVADLLPAGLEIENQNLDSAIKLDELEIDGKPLSESFNPEDLKYQGFRDDRYVAALDLDGSSTAHLFYLVRAVTPGDYRVPPPLVEDMYRPELRAVGATPAHIVIEE